MIAAYREEDRRPGRDLMINLIDSVSHGVPKALSEIITLGRTLKKRAAGVLAYFDRPGTSNGPTEAINGWLEHLRGSALGFRNLTNYHRQIPARDRRVQTATTPSIVKSRFIQWLHSPSRPTRKLCPRHAAESMLLPPR